MEARQGGDPSRARLAGSQWEGGGMGIDRGGSSSRAIARKFRQQAAFVAQVIRPTLPLSVYVCSGRSPV